MLFSYSCSASGSPNLLAHSSRHQPRAHAEPGFNRLEQILGRFILASETLLHTYFYVFFISPCPNSAQRQNSPVLAQGKKITW